MVNLLQLRRRSSVAVAALVAVAVFDALAVVSSFPHAAYLRSLPPGAPVFELDLVAPEALYALVGFLQSVAFVLAAVCFIRWFYAVYRNVAEITGRPTRHDASWAGWGFAVPFLNIVRPRQIMRETWDALTEHWLLRRDGAASQLPPDRITLWWGLFLGMGALNGVAARLLVQATTAETNLVAVRMTQMADGLSLVTALVAVLLVRNVTRLQALVADPAVDHVRAPAGVA